MPPVTRCPRCGTPRRDDLQVCVSCETPFDVSAEADPIESALPRPAAPSTVQSHGTVLLGILGGFVLLAALLALSVRDIGPFEARLVSFRGTGTVREVTVEISNEGERAGRGNCVVTFAAGRTARPAKRFSSERVEPGATLTQTITLTTDTDAQPTGVRCV